MAASTRTGDAAVSHAAPLAVTDEGVGWRGLVAVVVASRLVVLAAALVAELLVPRNPLLTGGDGAPILQSLTSWDGWWYLGIVRDGYHAAPLDGAYQDYAFLPLYPMLVRLLATPFPGWEGLIAVLLSNVLFAVGIVLLVRLTAPRFGPAFAYRSAALLAIFPFSAVFSMAYAESLFIVLMLGAFLAAERGRAVPAGLLLALATLTRLQGARPDRAARLDPVGAGGPAAAIRPSWARAAARAAGRRRRLRLGDLADRRRRLATPRRRVPGAGAASAATRQGTLVTR